MATDRHSREDIAHGLVRIGEQGIATEDDAALDAYYAPDFVFHGPDGDLDFPSLKAQFAALRNTFDGFTVTRDFVMVEGDFVAARTRMAGVFAREFTRSPVGPLPPTGNRVEWNLINIFRYDEAGRLAEEWVQWDTRGFLRQLGADER
jgi:predicted ester cyclase